LDAVKKMQKLALVINERKFLNMLVCFIIVI